MTADPGFTRCLSRLTNCSKTLKPHVPCFLVSCGVLLVIDKVSHVVGRVHLSGCGRIVTLGYAVVFPGKRVAAQHVVYFCGDTCREIIVTRCHCKSLLFYQTWSLFSTRIASSLCRTPCLRPFPIPVPTCLSSPHHHHTRQHLPRKSYTQARKNAIDQKDETKHSSTMRPQIAQSKSNTHPHLGYSRQLRRS